MRNSVLGSSAGSGSRSRPRGDDGLVDFSWNACAPQQDEQLTPGPSTCTSRCGKICRRTSYETTFIYGCERLVPDVAIRPGGLPGILVRHDRPPRARQGQARPTGGSPGQVRTSSLPADDQLPATRDQHARFAVRRLSAGHPTNPNTRYFLERVASDHTYSVLAGHGGETRGGWQTLMTFMTIRANYLTLPPGLEIPFGRNVPPGSPLYVTFNPWTPTRPPGGDQAPVPVGRREPRPAARRPERAGPAAGPNCATLGPRAAPDASPGSPALPVRHRRGSGSSYRIDTCPAFPPGRRRPSADERRRPQTCTQRSRRDRQEATGMGFSEAGNSATRHPEAAGPQARSATSSQNSCCPNARTAPTVSVRFPPGIRATANGAGMRGSHPPMKGSLRRDPCGIC